MRAAANLGLLAPITSQRSEAGSRRKSGTAKSVASEASSRALRERRERLLEERHRHQSDLDMVDLEEEELRQKLRELSECRAMANKPPSSNATATR